MVITNVGKQSFAYSDSVANNVPDQLLTVHLKTMFGSYLPPSVLFILSVHGFVGQLFSFLCFMLFALFVFVLCFLCPMLPVSLDCLYHCVDSPEGGV